MPCTNIKLGDGVRAIVCTRGRRKRIPCGVEGCTAAAEYQCDYPAEDPPTCDLHLCKRHAGKVGPDQHYCPGCVKLWQKSLQRGQHHEANP